MKHAAYTMLLLFTLTGCEEAARLARLNAVDNTTVGDNQGTPGSSGAGGCIDADGDGHFASTNCGALDCDDTNADVFEPITVQKDADGDGYSAGPEDLCGKQGVVPKGYLASASATLDCDDTDARLFTVVTGYRDLDGDLYTLFSPTQICAGSQFPAGYRSAPSASEDCEDNSSFYWRIAPIYNDYDNDGHGSTLWASQCIGDSVAAGLSFTNDDCNDDAMDPRASLYFNCARASTCIDADGDQHYAKKNMDGSGGCDFYHPPLYESCVDDACADCNDGYARQFYDCTSPCGDFDEDGAEAHCDDILQSKRDCDDTDSHVRPPTPITYQFGERSFPEIPGDGKDNNCNGLYDDEVSDYYATFVATTGSDTTGDGTQANPYRTVAFATGLNGGPVIVAGGTYDEAPINSIVSIHGGFKTGTPWTRDNPTPTVIRVASGASGYGVRLSSRYSPLAISRVTIEFDPTEAVVDYCEALYIGNYYSGPAAFAHIVISDVAASVRTKGQLGCDIEAKALSIRGGDQGVNQASKGDANMFVWSTGYQGGSSNFVAGPADSSIGIAIISEAKVELDSVFAHGGVGANWAVGLDLQTLPSTPDNPGTPGINEQQWDTSAVRLRGMSTFIGRDGGTGNTTAGAIGLRQNALGRTLPGGGLSSKTGTTTIMGCRNCTGTIAQANGVYVDDPVETFVLRNATIRGATNSPNVTRSFGVYSTSQVSDAWFINSVIEGGPSTMQSVGAYMLNAGPTHFIDSLIVPAEGTSPPATTYGVWMASNGWGGYQRILYNNYISSGVGTGTAIALLAESNYVTAPAFLRPGLMLFNNALQTARVGAIVFRHQDTTTITLPWDVPAPALANSVDYVATSLNTCDSVPSQPRTGGAADAQNRYACAAPGFSGPSGYTGAMGPSGDGAHGNLITNRPMSSEFDASYHLTASSVLIGRGEQPQFPWGYLLRDFTVYDELFDQVGAYNYLTSAPDFDGEQRPIGVWDIGPDER